MSPFSQVEMSPFAILKAKLRGKGDGKGDVTSDERTRTESAGSNPAGKKENNEATGSRRVAFTLTAADKALVPRVRERWRRGVGFKTTRSAFEQSVAGENPQESAAVVAQTLS